MDNKITVNSGDTLIKIVKREYGLQNDTDIMNTVNLIKQKNNLKNVNIIKVGQKLELPEQLRLNNVTVFGENETESLKPKQKNYYRANDIFGDTATKKNEYPNQGFVESAVNFKTKSTEYVENVVTNVRGFFTNTTSRDAKMADIFAKVNISKLTLALAEQECDVISLTEREESLESFYVNLIGGGNRNE